MNVRSTKKFRRVVEPKWRKSRMCVCLRATFRIYRAGDRNPVTSKWWLCWILARARVPLILRKLWFDRRHMFKPWWLGGRWRLLLKRTRLYSNSIIGSVVVTCNLYLERSSNVQHIPGLIKFSLTECEFVMWRTRIGGRGSSAVQHRVILQMRSHDPTL